MTILASGQLKVVPTTIFEVGIDADVVSSTQTVVAKVAFFNTSQTQQTVRLNIEEYAQPSRTVRQFQLKKDESGEYLEAGEFLQLANGDVLQAETTTDDVVNFIVLGAIS